MFRATKMMLSKHRKAAEDLNLIKVLQSEINHELSNPPSLLKDNNGSYLGDFVLDYDAVDSQDVVFRRKSESGEEVAISTLLAAVYPGDPVPFPRDVLMKVCVKKPGLSSVLQFDCEVYTKVDKPRFSILNACYLQSTSFPPSAYKGPVFSTLDPDLQAAFKQYLEAKGISQSLINFLIFHLHSKEQNQYLSWLRKLELLIEKAH